MARGLKNLRIEVIIPLSTDNVNPEELTWITRKLKSAITGVLVQGRMPYRTFKTTVSAVDVTIKESNALVEEIKNEQR